MDEPRYHLEKSYHGLVKVFEDCLQEIYRFAVRKNYSTERARELENESATSFRQVKSAEEAFRRIGFELLHTLTEDERDTLQLAFAKHYELRGHSDLVDKAYGKRVRPWPRRWRKVQLEKRELELNTQLVQRIVERAASVFGLKL